MGSPIGKGGVSRFILIALILLTVLYPGYTLVSRVDASVSTSSNAQASNSTSVFTLNEWNIPTPGAGPWGITVDQLGKIWFTENVTNKIGRFDPINNNFTEWSVPGGGNPRYVFTKQVTSGGNNVTRVYFTEYSSNKIAYFNSWNGTFYEWQLPVNSNPVGVYVDSNYTIWFTESGRDAIGRLNPNTNQLTEWTLPGATGTPGTPSLEPWGIYVKSGLTGPFANVTDRFVWFTELANNVIGRLQITNNLLVVWDLSTINVIPGLRYGPMGIMVDSTTPGNVIFSASTGDRISVLQNCGTTCTGYLEYTLPSRTTIAKPTSVAMDSARNVVWFTEYNSGIIAGANRTTQGNPATVPTSTACAFPPTAGPVCASPSAYATTTAALTVTNNVVGTSQVGISQPRRGLSVFQGPINGITEYKLPNITARPNFVSLDNSGDIWFTESNVTVNRIGRMSIPYVFQLSVSPGTQSINRGQSASYAVTVGITSGNPLPVTLMVNSNQNMSASFTPPVGIPPFSSTLTVATSNATNPGTYTMTVTASSGGQSETSQISLTVNPPPPPPSFDYRIDVTNGASIPVLQGQQAVFQFQTSLTTSAASEMVNLTVDQSQLPSGTTVTQFNGTSGRPPFSSTLVLQTSITTPAGSYDLTNAITGLLAGSSPHHPREPVILLITEIPRDFALTASTNATNVIQASRIDLTVTVTPIGPFAGNVSLSGQFVPSVSQLTVTFTPSTISTLPNGVAQSTMEITAARTTPGQTYQLTIVGKSDVPSRTHQITISVHVSPCLIATAAFGSELAPEVQTLREFRDQQVLQTFAGSNFMTLFNSWYYSFSPAIARYEITHAVSRSIIRASLYPLIEILHLASATYSTLEFQPEFAVLTSGILASYLIGLAYFALPISSLCFLFRTNLPPSRRRKSAKLIVTLVVSLIAAYCVAEVFKLGLVMTIASAGIVMTFSLGVSALSVVSIMKLALSKLHASGHAA